MSTLYAITAPIGADVVQQAGTLTTSVSVPGATVGMTVSVTPESYPGAGIFWEGFVSAPDVVTVKISSVLAGEILTTRYFVQVNDGAGGGGFGGLTVLQAQGTLSSADLQAGSTITLVTPPAGTIAMPLFATAEYIPGTTPYDQDPDFRIGFGSTNVWIIDIGGLGLTAIDGSVGSGFNAQSGWSLPQQVDQPLVAGLFNGTPVADGDGTILVTLQYYVYTPA